MEEASKLLGAILRWLFIQWLWEQVCFQMGRGTLWALTLGRYPADRATAERDEDWLSGVGMVMLILGLLGIALWNRTQGN